MNQQVTFTTETASALSSAIEAISPDKSFVLTDENTCRYADIVATKHTLITVPAGESRKTLETAAKIWTALQEGGATRKSLLINLGGGVITDLGGFAAATFKRGMRFVNVPTTVLAAVDAATGGKTGVDFNGLKNEIGMFREAESVIISPEFFATLPQEEILSGYAEMLKHGLLTSEEMTARLLKADPLSLTPREWLPLLEESVAVKQRIVEEDPYESGRRKALNLGHTVGHAIEELLLQHGDATRHGYAVAWGLVASLVLSRMNAGFPSDKLHQVAAFIREHYGSIPVTCNHYDELIRFMHHDKKNTGDGKIAFTLLEKAGSPLTDCPTNDEDIVTALDIARDLVP